MNSQSLIRIFSYNAEMVNTQFKDITHEQSLIQPVAGSNNLNWLLGHLISSRTFPLRYVGAESIWTDEQRVNYRHGSMPGTANTPGIIHTDELLDLFHQSQDRLILALSKMTVQQLSASSGFQSNSLFDSLSYFHFHETYHIGQITMIAAFLGKSTAYIAENI